MPKTVIAVTQSLQDFSGGLSTLMAPNRIAENQSPSCTNTWYDNGAIAKRYGQTRTSGFSYNSGTNAWNGLGAYQVAFSGASSLIMNVATDAYTNAHNVLLSTTDAISVSEMPSNPTGTAAVTNGSPTVVGTGTNWLTTARANSFLKIGTVYYLIQSVDTNLQITLAINYPATTLSGLAHNIYGAWPRANRVSIVSMNSKAWICGVGAITQSWNGTVAAFVDAFPSAQYSILYKNYVVAANTTSNPSRVSWCSLKDPTTWPASNFVDVNPDDGFPIVGLVYDGQSVVILKTNSAYKLTGDVLDPANPTYTLTRIAVPDDFIINTPRTFQPFQGGYVILGKKGFYAYAGGGVISKIDSYTKIQGEFDSTVSFSESGVPTAALEPSSVAIGHNVLFQVSQVGGINNLKETTFVLDPSGAAWKWSYLNVASMADFAYLANTPYALIGGGAYNGGLASLGVTSASDVDSSAISATWTSKVFEYNVSQRFGRCSVYFKKQAAGSLSFSYSVDEGAYTTVSVDMTAPTATRAKYTFIMGVVGSTIQFQLNNSTVAQPWEAYGIEFERNPLRQ